MEPVGFGLVGCGEVAQKHALALAEAQNARLVAVYDVEASRARELAERHGVRACGSYGDLLRVQGVEVVDLATPAGTHLTLGLEAARAGRHLLVEKPLAATLGDADALTRGCAEAGVKLGVMLQKRLDPVVVSLERLLRSGALGRVRLASLELRWNRDDGYFGRAPWRRDPAAGGGCLLNQAIHGLDLLVFLFGAVEEAFAYLGFPGGVGSGCAVGPAAPGAGAASQGGEPAAEDNAAAVLRLVGGGLGVVQASTTVYPCSLEQCLNVFAEKGTVCVAGRSLDVVRVWEVEGGAAPPPAVPAEPAYSGHLRMIEGVSRAVRRGGPPPVDGLQARASLELALALRLSAAGGAPVRLPLAPSAAVAQ